MSQIYKKFLVFQEDYVNWLVSSFKETFARIKYEEKYITLHTWTIYKGGNTVHPMHRCKKASTDTEDNRFESWLDIQGETLWRCSLDIIVVFVNRSRRGRFCTEFRSIRSLLADPAFLYTWRKNIFKHDFLIRKHILFHRYFTWILVCTNFTLGSRCNFHNENSKKKHTLKGK